MKVYIFILILRTCQARLHNSGLKHFSVWVGFVSPDFNHLKVCCWVWADHLLSIYDQCRERDNLSCLLWRWISLWRCLWL